MANNCCYSVEFLFQSDSVLGLSVLCRFMCVNLLVIFLVFFLCIVFLCDMNKL